jgi:hypothetical protein
MYNTLLKMGFRGELNELIDTGQHTAIFTALDKTASYMEQGSFTHDGVRYSMPKALSRSNKKRTRKFRVSDLDWVLKYDTPSSDRVQKADLSAPILVARDKDGRLTAVDGLHRLTKAVQSGISTLPGKYLSKEDLRMSRVSPSYKRGRG